MGDLFSTSVFGIRQFTSGAQQEDLLENVVFVDNTQSKDTPVEIDWDEMDLQLFDSTSASESTSESTSEEGESEATTEGDWFKTYDSEGNEMIQYRFSDGSPDGLTVADFVEEEVVNSDGTTVSVLKITSINSEALNESGQLVLNFGGFDNMLDETTSESESEGAYVSDASTSNYALLDLSAASAPILLKNNHEFTNVQGSEDQENDLYAGRHGSQLRGGSKADTYHGTANRRDTFVATYGNDRVKNYGAGDRIRMGAYFADIIGSAVKIILKKIQGIVGSNDTDGDDAETPTIYYGYDSEGNIVLYNNAEGTGDHLTIEGIKDPGGDGGTLGNQALRLINDGGSPITWEILTEEVDVIDKDSRPKDIEVTFGITDNYNTFTGNSSMKWMNKTENGTLPGSDSIFDGTSTVAGASYADLDKSLEVWLSNIDTTEAQTFDVSSRERHKKVHLNEGEQAITFNPAVNGNVVEIPSIASGVKNITLGGGDAVIVDMEAGEGSVNILGGAGNDSVVVRDAAPVTFDMSKGGKDIIYTFAAANARISLEGYDPSTGAAIEIEEQGATNVAAAIQDSLIGFGNGVLIIQSGENKSKIDIDSAEDGTNNGWIVNLKTPDKDSDSVQAVGFTSEDGGLVDASDYTKPVILVGNMNGSKTAGSSLYGGDSNDTFFGGAGDLIDGGDGKDLVILDEDSTRDGAVINISEGRTTITGSNNTLGGFTGDTIAIDDLDISTTKFTYAGDSLIIQGEGFKAELTAVTSLEGGYTTQYIENTTTGSIYGAAIGAESSTMYVAEDEESRASAYIGKNSKVDFTNYSGDVLVDLNKEWRDSFLGGEFVKGIDGELSYVGGVKAYYEGVNQLVAGEGKTIFKGSDEKETLIAGKGDTSLYGAGGLNSLVGYEGDDKIGNTTFFVLGVNEGAVHTISGFEFVKDNNYINAADVTADRIETDIENNHFSNVGITEDGDILLEITKNGVGSTERALLKDAFDTGNTYSKDFVVNGVVAQVGEDNLVFDKYANFYLAKGTNATLTVDSTVTDKSIIWLDDSLEDRGSQFEGDFTVIDARNSNAVRSELAGNDNDNIIYAGTGETSLWGGNGGNDLLVGNDRGIDSFYYAAGNGNDVIDNAGDGDSVNFVNLTLADITIETISSSAVVFNFSDGGKLTVNDNGSDVKYKVGEETYGLDENRQFVQK